MAELADAIDLGSIVNRRAGSSPVIRINEKSYLEYIQVAFLIRNYCQVVRYK